MDMERDEYEFDWESAIGKAKEEAQKKAKIKAFERLAGSAPLVGEDISELLKSINHEDDVASVENKSVNQSIRLLSAHLILNQDRIENLEYHLAEYHEKMSEEERKEIISDIAELKMAIISHQQAIEILTERKENEQSDI